MFQRIRAVLARRFVRHAALLQVGTVGAMLVQAVANIVVARQLGPDQFGRYAIAMSLAAVGSVLLGAGAADAMAPVVSRARHERDERGLQNAFLFLGKFVLISGLVVIVLGCLLPVVAERLYADTAIGWFALSVLVASALSTLLFTPTQLGLQVFGRIGGLSALTFADQAIRQALVVGLVIAGFGVAGASAGHLVGAVVVVGVSAGAWHLLRSAAPALPTIPAFWVEQPTDGRRYIAPALWVLVDRNVAMLYGAAPVALAGMFLATADVSYVKVAFGWVTLALSVLGPVSVLLNTELARIQVQEPERLGWQFTRVTLAAVCASSIVTLGAAVVARPIFLLLYGVDYLPAVPLVYWLVPFGMLFGLGIALGPMWRALNRVRVSILINCLVLGTGIPLGMFAMSRWGALGAIAMVTGWYTVSHVASFVYLLRALKAAR